MLTTARTALLAAGANTAPARVLWVGDSFVEGEGASTLANTFRMRTVAALRTLFGIPGSGLGLIPGRTYYTYLTASSSWRAPSSGTATATPNWNISQGTKGIRFTASGQYREWSVTGTAIDLCYLQAGGAGGGNITLAVNGSTVATINANDSGQAYQPTKHYRHVFAGGVGTYTVRATSGSTQGIVDGPVIYNGDHTGGGLIAYDCSRTGAQSNLIAVDDIINGWPAIQPHLVVDDQVGSNDFLDAARNPTAVVGFLNTRLDAYAALTSSPTVVILVPWRLAATAGTNALGFTYEQYITAVKSACASHAYAASIKVLDLQDIYPTASSQAWHDADGLHPNNTGHQQIADALVAFIGTLGVQTATGTVVGTSATAGATTRLTPATGTTVGTSATAGAVNARRVVAGVAAGVVAVAGTATALLPTTGAAAASSTASGSVTVTRAAAGTVAATSTVSGSAVPVGGLSGTVNATSSTAGNAIGRLVANGTAAAVSAASGAVEFAAGPAALSGTVVATSASSGTVTARLAATGSVVATSTVSGAAAAVDQPDQWPVTGAVIAVSAVSGSAVNPRTQVIRVLSVTTRTRDVQIASRTRTVTIEEST